MVLDYNLNKYSIYIYISYLINISKYIYISKQFYSIYSIPADSSSISVESSLIPVDSCGFQSHSSGFLWIPVPFPWIPVESSHSCRNVRGIEKYCTGGIAYFSDFQGTVTWRVFYPSESHVLTFTSRSWDLSYWSPDSDLTIRLLLFTLESQYLTSPSQLGNNIFGDGNLGEAFDQFPIQHECNKYCHWFKLDNPSKISKKAGCSRSQAGADTKKSKGKKAIVPTNFY